jgi:GT2 family glycosyltransferase
MVLYHRRQRAFEETGYGRVRYPLPDPLPTVSVFVPTRDRLDLLRPCIDGLRDATDYPNLDLVIIDNGSERADTLAYFRELAQHGVRILRIDGPFNYSALHNQAISQARGSLIALLNNDIAIMHADWLLEMVSQAVRPDVGAVGAKLYYPDGSIQHAGVVLGLGGAAGHLHRTLPKESAGNCGDLRLARDVSCVTAACLVMRKSVFDETGGFDEDGLKVAYNDVDLCLKIRAAGYRIVWTPHAELTHFECATRGATVSAHAIHRELREIATMKKRWGKAFGDDPFYNPNLTIDTVFCGLATPPRVKKPWRLI